MIIFNTKLHGSNQHKNVLIDIRGVEFKSIKRFYRSDSIFIYENIFVVGFLFFIYQ